MSRSYLKDILTAQQEPIVSLYDITPFGDAEIGADGTVKVKSKGGIRTANFITTEDVVISLNIRSDKHLTVKVAYIDSHGDMHLDGTEEKVSVSVGEGCESIWKTFDAANLAVYRDAKEFYIQLECDGENEFKITGGTVRGRSELERLSVYSDNLEGIIRNIDKRLAAIEYQSAANTENIVASPSGKKFKINVDDDGNVSATPIVPSKVLFVGNSLLLGMGFYGMCATAPDKDYFHIVSEAIRAKNPDVEISRAHGARFEQLEDPELFDKLWSEDPNPHTGKPSCESFTPDLDLIIMQIVENVNSDIRYETFKETIDKFILNIKKSSPKARIVWVRSWWGSARRDAVVEDACRRHRIGCISISDLYSRKTIGHTGQTYVTADGSLKVAPELWLGHPGDEGMQAIADRIIDYLKL